MKGIDIKSIHYQDQKSALTFSVTHFTFFRRFNGQSNDPCIL